MNVPDKSCINKTFKNNTVSIPSLKTVMKAMNAIARTCPVSIDVSIFPSISSYKVFAFCVIHKIIYVKTHTARSEAIPSKRSPCRSLRPPYNK